MNVRQLRARWADDTCSILTSSHAWAWITCERVLRVAVNTFCTCFPSHPHCYSSRGYEAAAPASCSEVQDWIFPLSNVHIQKSCRIVSQDGQICVQMPAFRLKEHIESLIELEGGASIAKLINVVKVMPPLCSKRPSRSNHVILSKQALISLSIMTYGRKPRLQPQGALVVGEK